MLAVDYQKGMVMIEERGYSEHEGFFQDVLEIARRHKIMNPEKMRTEYAKVGVGVEALRGRGQLRILSCDWFVLACVRLWFHTNPATLMERAGSYVCVGISPCCGSFRAGGEGLIKMDVL